jgi:hypothetical protein
MLQLMVIRPAVISAMPIVRGDRTAARISWVRPSRISTTAAIGTDQTTRCATTSTAGMWLTAFM